jgi:SAM-dependent methyltransferase
MIPGAAAPPAPLCAPAARRAALDVSYFESDFDYELHAATCRRDEEPTSSLPTGWGDDGAQAAAWQAFHATHKTGFFKQRRYLLKAFPQLSFSADDKRLRTVLELGCGNGSSALPLLSNEALRVAACDFAPSAVAACRAAAVDPQRLAVFLADAARSDDFVSELRAATAHWNPPLLRADAVLAVFVLSALPPHQVERFLANALSTLAPGGWLLVRDYAPLDLTHLRFGDAARLAPLLYQRQDGTLSRFLSTERLEHEVCSAATAAGFSLAVHDCRYACVELRNRATGVSMRRAFVHASFKLVRPADADA